MELGSQAAAWLSLLVATIAAAFAYFAWGRRRLSATFGGAKFIAAPRDKLGIGVTYHGVAVELPVYLVNLRLRCIGNRDITMIPQGEFIEIEAAEDVEILTAAIRPPGKMQLARLEDSPRKTKFSFDLLKHKEEISINLYVKTAGDIEAEPLNKRFVTTAHIRDVRLVKQPSTRTHRLLEAVLLLSATVSVAIIFLAVSTFFPVASDRLYLDDNGNTVIIRNAENQSVKVCAVALDPFTTVACENRPMSVVGRFTPAPTDKRSYFSNSSGYLDLFIIIGAALASMGVAFTLYASGDRVSVAFNRLLREV